MLLGCLESTCRAAQRLPGCPAGARSRRRAEELLRALDALAPYEEALPEPEAEPDPAADELSATQAVLYELRQAVIKALREAGRPLAMPELRARLLGAYDGNRIQSAVTRLRYDGLVRVFDLPGEKYKRVAPNEAPARAAEAARELPDEDVVEPGGRRHYAVPPRDAALLVLADCPELTKADVKMRMWQMGQYSEPAIEKALRELKLARVVRIGRLPGRNAALVQLVRQEAGAALKMD